jgi:hypothetical protein
METICTSETSLDFYLTPWCYTPEDRTLHSHRCENFKSKLLCSLSSTLMMETRSSFETAVQIYRIILRHTPEDNNLHCNACENFNALKHGPTRQCNCLHLLHVFGNRMRVKSKGYERQEVKTQCTGILLMVFL